MKLAVLGGAIAICAATAIVAAQAPAAPTDQTQTVLGCLKGEGTAQSPWVLAGVVIPPPAPAGRGGGGAGRGGPGRGGAGAPGAGREGGGPPPAAAPAPPPPPPAPIDIRITGMDMTPWRGYRVQIEGMLSPAGAGMRTITATSARSVYNTCEGK